MSMSIEAGWRKVEQVKLCRTFFIGSRDLSTGRTQVLAFGNERPGPVPVRPDVVANKKLPFTPFWTSPRGEMFFLRGNGTDEQCLISISAGRETIVLSLKAQIAFADISWKMHRLFISFHSENGRNAIDAVDLKSGKRRTVHESAMLHGVAISNNGDLVHWPLVDFGPIESLRSSGKNTRLTEFGWYPAFSRRGDMAFLMGDHTLWLRSTTGRLTRAASSWSPVDPAQTDFPSWCPCGRHVAAQIGGRFRDRWLARDLVIVDLGRKEIMVKEQCATDPAAHRGESGWSAKPG